ncbi:MAG: glycosyltransferase [Ignavibacteria bacterium]|nr:glycosyltransferase [Ignavibacteria bacterium]
MHRESLQTLNNINYELIIIDNASTDGTNEYLNKLSLNNRKVRVIESEINLGTNAKSVGAESSKGEFIIGIDDDVIFFPENWIQNMVKAYKNIPDMGYLATDVIQDETTNGAKHPPDMYFDEKYDNGNIVLQIGPTGGWCFMISREVYQKIGKFLKFEGRIFFPEDGDYVNRIINNGLKYGILSGVKVYHATGEFHNKNFMKIYEQKHKDFKIGDPFFYSLINKSKRLLSLKRYITKLKEYSIKNSL